MWVIYKQVKGFYYYARIVNDKIEWVGLIDNATKWSDKEIAVLHAESFNLTPEQVKKI